MDKTKFMWNVLKHFFKKEDVNLNKLSSHILEAIVVVKSDVMAYAVFTDKIIFAWQESNDIKDWVKNFCFTNNFWKYLFSSKKKLENDKITWVHKDMNKVATIYTKIVKNILETYNKGGQKEIWFGGFSRGGGIAKLVSNKVTTKAKTVLITFGQPKVTESNKEIDHTRVYYQRDIVTKVPRKFKHPKAKEIKLKSKWWHWIPGATFKVHTSYDEGIKEL